MNLSKEVRYQQRTYAERIYANGLQEDSTYMFQLKLLCIYLRDEMSMEPKERGEFIKAFCHKYYEGFHERKDYQLLIDVDKYGRRESNVLIQMDGVDIYVKDLEYIESLTEDLNERKLMVALLAKKEWDCQIYKLRHPCDGYKSFLSYEYTTRTAKRIGKIARVSKNADIFYEVFGSLARKGLVRFEKKGNLTLLFLANAVRGGETAFHVTDVDYIGLHYERWLGEKRIGVCEVCGRAFWKNCNAQKFCKMHLDQAVRERKWVREFQCGVCGKRTIVSSYDTHSTLCSQCLKDGHG